MKFEKLQPGIEIYDVRSYQMGNTSLRSVGIWPVRVIEVNQDRTILASWNGNTPRKMHENEWSKYRQKPPELESYGFGQRRIKRRTTEGKKSSEER